MLSVGFGVVVCILMLLLGVGWCSWVLDVGVAVGVWMLVLVLGIVNIVSHSRPALSLYERVAACAVPKFESDNKSTIKTSSHSYDWRLCFFCIGNNFRSLCKIFGC